MNFKNLKKRPGGVVGFVVLLVVVTILASGLVAVYTIFLNPENKSAVPQLVGSSTVAAVSEAERLGLVVQLEPVASTMPEGRVLAQSPEAGETLRKGQVIVLQVSQGGDLHPIPDVKGKTLTQAQDEIKAQGFSLGDVIKISEPNVKPGTVIAQSPAAPANVTSGRKIDLLVQAGTAQAENITIPDVNRMTEDEARNVLETSGVKIQGIERVYSPMVPEGLAIETRPGAGTLIKPGQGVVLKLATQRKPAGSETQNESSRSSTARGNGTVTSPRNIPNQNQDKKEDSKTAASQNQNNNRGVTVSVGGQEEVFIGDDYDLTTQTETAKNSQPAKSAPVAAQTQSPAKTQTSSNSNSSNSRAAKNTEPEEEKASTSTSAGGKTARIRYQVPPIGRPMDLKIEITDPNGTRTVMNRQVRSGESISTSANYSQEAIIKIFLGGESVWQERQR